MGAGARKSNRRLAREGEGAGATESKDTVRTEDGWRERKNGDGLVWGGEPRIERILRMARCRAIAVAASL